MNTVAGTSPVSKMIVHQIAPPDQQPSNKQAILTENM